MQRPKWLTWTNVVKVLTWTWWSVLLVFFSLLAWTRAEAFTAGQATGPDVVLLVVWLALALAPIFHEVNVFGLKLKREVEGLRKEIAEIKISSSASILQHISVSDALHGASPNQLTVALYEKMHMVYDGVKDLIGAAVGKAALSNQDIRAFSISTQESVFLFEADIKDYLQEVRMKANELHAYSMQLDGQLPVGEERSRLARQHMELVKWFSAQYEASTQKFYKYLSFNAHL